MSLPTSIRWYRDLQVWQVALDLVVDTYRLVAAFPKHETYGLARQARDAAVSIPANIAEGHGREHLGDYLHHLSVANGSLMELETHCLIAERLEYVTQQEARRVLDRAAEVGRMLAGLTRSLKRIRERRGNARHLTPDT
ncbi:MAG: four helix bundle protein [Burkholderiales bacterium]